MKGTLGSHAGHPFEVKNRFNFIVIYDAHQLFQNLTEFPHQCDIDS